MEERHLTIAKGNQTISHVSYLDHWVACVVEHEGEWMVGVVYLNGAMASDFLKVLKSSNKELKADSRPVDISFTTTSILSVALHNDGIHLFSMVAPVGPSNARIAPMDVVRLDGQYIQRAVWIGNMSDMHAMVTFGHSRSTAIGSIMIHSFGVDAQPASVLATENSPNQIRFFDGCTPGHVAFISIAGVTNQLTLLIREGVVFDRSCMAIGKDSEKRPSALAIGNKLAVVGYSYPPGLTDGVGLIEVFNICAKSVQTTRSIPQSVPTALCTNGARVLVGASTAVPWGHNTSVSTVYCFNSNKPENFAIAKGGEEHPTWFPRSMRMSSDGWCIARTIVGDSGERFSGIDCARIVAR